MEISIGALESAINRCRTEVPVFNKVLPSDLRALANVYGGMIHFHRTTVELATLPDREKAAVQKWIAVQADSPSASAIVQPFVES